MHKYNVCLLVLSNSIDFAIITIVNYYRDSDTALGPVTIVGLDTVETTQPTLIMLITLQMLVQSVPKEVLPERSSVMITSSDSPQGCHYKQGSYISAIFLLSIHQFLPANVCRPGKLHDLPIKWREEAVGNASLHSK